MLVSKAQAAQQLGITKTQLNRVLRLSGVTEQVSPTDGRIILVDVDALKTYLKGFQVATTRK